ncbi:winged helix-turn-helix domain-containing protein [Nocardia sp. CS682]|uniref:AfsR/SARP family transcriptional regulator n=1 Tax=Nocardia sp. CS682 TaxID=1047172 RepID=UPI001075503F|nr:winged helix-turn-helix domain-containing protein [Nocardia sp. CS682]QBS41353.1 hypothetical protein DMB37_15690 [Nocardia sp. CS682]
MLIAITGIGHRTGVTTAAVALSAAWPGPEQAVLIEADPRGGHLAEHVLSGTGLGLVRLAAAVGTDRCGLAQLVEHTQLLPTGVPVLTAPASAEQVRAMLVAPALSGSPTHRADDGGPVVIADCGIAHPDSAALPLVAGADALIVLVRPQMIDAGLAARRIREIAGWNTRARAVVLVGSDRGCESASGLGVPVMGRLPIDARGVSVMLHGDRGSRHRGALASAAEEIATALRTQLVNDEWSLTRVVGERCGRGRSRPRWRDLLPRSDIGPSVYRHPGRLSSRDLAIHAEPTPPPTGFANGVEPGGNDAALEISTSSPDPSAHRAPVNAGVEAGTSKVSNEHREPVPSLSVNVLGPLRVTWYEGSGTGCGFDITCKLQPRSRELVALLALHPSGISRDRLVEALWGARSPARPTNAINTALTRLRAALAAATNGAVPANIITDARRHYQLNPASVAVDYWKLAEAVDARRQANSDQARLDAYRRIIESAGRPVAQDLCTDWIEPLREAVRRDHLNALGALARSLVEDDPRRTLDLLETAIAADPYNEPIYCDIMRLHAKLGEYDAIERTVLVLRRRLAELGQTPTSQTCELAQRLRQQAP